MIMKSTKPPNTREFTGCEHAWREGASYFGRLMPFLQTNKNGYGESVQVLVEPDWTQDEVADLAQYQGLVIKDILAFAASDAGIIRQQAERHFGRIACGERGMTVWEAARWMSTPAKLGYAAIPARLGSEIEDEAMRRTMEDLPRLQRLREHLREQLTHHRHLVPEILPGEPANWTGQQMASATIRLTGLLKRLIKAGVVKHPRESGIEVNLGIESSDAFNTVNSSP